MNVLLIDDHRLIYQGFERQFDDLVDLYYASDAASAKEIIHSRTIDIAVVDISLGRENGFDVARDIRNFVDKIFMLTMHKSGIYLQQTIDEGYHGYYLKDESLELMGEAFRDPDKREFWMTDEVASVRKEDRFTQDELYDKLSPREQQILRMIAEGKGYREIGDALSISAKTVNVHRANIMKKLNIENQIDIVKYALKIGIINLD